MQQQTRVKTPEWWFGFLAWIAVYRWTTWFIAFLTLVPASLLAFVSAQYLDIAALLVASPALWWLLGAVALLGLGSGVWSGITIHRSFASRRNAPLGYRIEKVEHFYRFDPSNPQKQVRRRTDYITAKRDEVNLVLGRFRPSMSNAPTPRSISKDVNVALIQQSSHPSDWHYYVVHWRTSLDRGQTKVVTVELEVNDVDGTASPRYSTTIRDFTNELFFQIEIPRELVKDGAFHCYATRIDNGLERGEIPLSYSYDESLGKLTAEEKHPRRNWTYVIKWEWAAYPPVAPSLIEH